MREPRILTIDIETAPNLGWVWGLWDQNIGLNQLAQESTILCFAAKWLGDSKVIFYSLETHTAEEMIKAAWNLLNEADVVVGFNHKSFDNKHMNKEFLLLGLGAPSYYSNIDLLTLVRSKFKFVSNKLEHIADVLKLKVGKKMKTSGFELWLGCMAGILIPGTEINHNAWKEMKKYNIQDVNVTEGAYLALRACDTSSVNLAIYSGYEDACRACAGRSLVKQGFKAKGTNVYQQYKCKDCGAWSIGKTAIKEDDDGLAIVRPLTRAI